jgi:hypothetical protein
MKESRNDKRKVTVNDEHIQIELTTIKFDDEQSNFQRQGSTEDFKINSELPHRFDRLQLNMNGEEILDQRQMAIVMEASDNASTALITKNRRIVEDTIEELCLLTTHIIGDIRADLGPIVGYAAEPLLPLSKACSPLNNIIHNLLFYVQMALE